MYEVIAFGQGKIAATSPGYLSITSRILLYFKLLYVLFPCLLEGNFLISDSITRKKQTIQYKSIFL